MMTRRTSIQVVGYAAVCLAILNMDEALTHE